MANARTEEVKQQAYKASKEVLDTMRHEFDRLNGSIALLEDTNKRLLDQIDSLKTECFRLKNNKPDKVVVRKKRTPSELILDNMKADMSIEELEALQKLKEIFMKDAHGTFEQTEIK